MGQTAFAKRRGANGIPLATTLACYIGGLGCVLGLTYSPAAPAAPGLGRHAAPVGVDYGP